MAPSVYLPAMVFEIGNGAVAPVIAITALDLGGSAGTAGLLVALLGIGQLVGDVPAGALAARLGDRRAMVVAGGVSMGAMLGLVRAAARHRRPTHRMRRPAGSSRPCGPTDACS